MKGKVLSIITAILFGATMLAAPVVNAQTSTTGAAGMEEQAPAKKKPAKKKHAKKKKPAKKKAAKKSKKPSKKKAAEPKDTM